jgi:hypothetical protein
MLAGFYASKEYAEHLRRIRFKAPDTDKTLVRQEGDTTIVPVVEEVLVVERRLMLKEEIRIKRVRTTERASRSKLSRWVRESMRFRRYLLEIWHNFN